MFCKYCRYPIVSDSRVGACHLFLECQYCGEPVHLKCLKSGGTPGRLNADVFFIFTCSGCSSDGSEAFLRMKMTWTDIVFLVLYNLTVRHHQASLDGYFHKDKQIRKFLKNHWSTFFPHMKTKRKTWVQMLHSALKNSPHYFKQGSSPIWFKLADPNFLPNQAMCDRKERLRRSKKIDNFDLHEDSSTCTTNYSSSSRDADFVTNPDCSSSFTIFNEQSDTQNNMYSRSYVKPSARLSEFLFAGEEDACDLEINNKGQEDEDVDIEFIDTDAAVKISNESNTDISLCKMITSDEEKMPVIKEEPMSEEDEETESNFPETTLGQAVKTTPQNESKNNQCLLTKRNKMSSELPWLRNGSQFKSSQCKPMNLSEEAYELTALSRRIAAEDSMSVAELRLYRKLKLRRIKREKNLPLFNLDEYTKSLKTIESAAKQSTADHLQTNFARVLDRFLQSKVVLAHGSFDAGSISSGDSFLTRLMGGTSQQLTCFVSPFTQRTLKPFIRRDFESRPLWLKLLEELRSKFHGSTIAEQTAPIDYCYVRPQHIPAVNSLAEQYFWPGINCRGSKILLLCDMSIAAFVVSECLQFPDFSCVVLYKKLIVAFAFLVPDSYHNEAYISFILTRPEWRRAGIATFMLYHLIQTCRGRDITLHVSATNPALLLYQKFGFKTEEFVQNFYDKYLPIDSNECRHALYLRLKR